MIRIDRPADAPAVLSGRGIEQRDRHIADFESDDQAYRSGAKTFKYRASIYGHKTVKNKLKRMQNSKCAFCEARVPHVAHGDVEHFRPKAGYKQAVADDLMRPGYYWLAYDWHNLLFACQICNQRHKSNLFPLVDNNARARDHTDDPNAEAPLFIDPAREDPAGCIGFQREYAVAVDANDRGAATIAGLGLNRSELVEARQTLRQLVLALARLVAINPDQPEANDARQLLEKMQGASREFSAMTRATIAEVFA